MSEDELGRYKRRPPFTPNSGPIMKEVAALAMLAILAPATVFAMRPAAVPGRRGRRDSGGLM